MASPDKYKSLIATLYKDPAINAYLSAEHMSGYIKLGTGFAKEILCWDGNHQCQDTPSNYYYGQRVSNVIQGVLDAAGESPAEAMGSAPFSKALTITLRPKADAKDTYIFNQAYAQVVGGNPPSTQ